MRRRVGTRKKPLVLMVIGIAVICIAVVGLMSTMKNKQEKLVEQFFELEQEGDYGSSWELFHSQMKQQFNKDQYIQSRAHVFMQDMDANGFTFELGGTDELKEWKSSEGGSTLKNVHEVVVYQTFHTKFGKFTIEHPCYVAKEKGEWKLLWDYNLD